jgi:hypothetical protein
VLSQRVADTTASPKLNTTDQKRASAVSPKAARIDESARENLKINLGCRQPITPQERRAQFNAQQVVAASIKLG